MWTRPAEKKIVNISFFTCCAHQGSGWWRESTLTVLWALHRQHTTNITDAREQVPVMFWTVLEAVYTVQVLHQKKHFCCGWVFLLHDNGVLASLKLFKTQPSFQLCKLAIQKACDSDNTLMLVQVSVENINISHLTCLMWCHQPTNQILFIQHLSNKPNAIQSALQFDEYRDLCTLRNKIWAVKVIKD